MLIVDRIESGIAVCEVEQGESIEIPLTLLPPEISEGDVLDVDETGECFIDSEATAQRKDALKGRLDRLFQRK